MSEKIGALLSEISKVDEKLSDFSISIRTSFESLESEILKLKSLLYNSETSCPDDKARLNCLVQSIKTKLSDHVRSHRHIHPSISKFGKQIDKGFTDDLHTIATYFMDRMAPAAATNNSSNKPTENHSPQDLLNLIIIEHLLREGQQYLSTDLASTFNFDPDVVRLNEFNKLSDLLSSLKNGETELPRSWLKECSDELAAKTFQLEYLLAKVDFLSTTRRYASDPNAIILCARKLARFAQNYPAEFEHLMGSLAFLGRGLENTPYCDLPSLPEPSEAQESMQVSGQTSRATSPVGDGDDDSVHRMEADEPQLQPVDSSGCAMATAAGKPATAAGGLPRSFDSTLEQVASLTRRHYCHQLGLPDTDPLVVIFETGCRLLSKQKTLHRAIACMTEYHPSDCDTLPVAVELDPAAHRHNVFHCPVIKEVATPNNGPVRLNCGHAISKAAFESLSIGDRRGLFPLLNRPTKMKCPYCPVKTSKDQVLRLIF